jgi:acyl carrier protein
VPTVRDQISSAMYAAVAATMNRTVDELSDLTGFIADLDAKSVNFVRIIAELESEFDLEIPFMEFRRRKTLGEAIDYVARLYES